MHVLIHVRGGVVQVVQAPPEVEVVIVDFDGDQANCTCCSHYGGTIPCEGMDCRCCVTCAPD